MDDAPRRSVNEAAPLLSGSKAKAKSKAKSKSKSAGAWKRAVADDGRVYYYNAVTKETSWTKP